MERQLVTSGT